MANNEDNTDHDRIIRLEEQNKTLFNRLNTETKEREEFEKVIWGIAKWLGAAVAGVVIVAVIDFIIKGGLAGN